MAVEALRKPTAAPRPARARKPGRSIEISRGAAVLYVAIVLGLALLLWSSRREHESHVRVPDLRSFEPMLPSIAGLTGSAILPGNRVEVLQNGDEFFPALFHDIEAARETINLETYVWWEGEICQRLADALAAKARQGVQVRLMLDAVGSKKADNELLEQMDKAGVKIAKFHPFDIKDLGLFNNRTHRKLAIFDGRVAHVFGHGVAKEWTGNGQDEKHWRDTGVRVEGPIVHDIQAVFTENWLEQTTEPLVGTTFFPPLAAVGPVRAHVTASSPQGGVSKLELLYKLAIATAQKELLLQNPYFIPDGEVVGLLEGAVRRGVDVRVMLPGTVTDSSVVQHAGHYHYGELLSKGIKIYEHQKTLTHQKVMVVDGIWSHVGSTNFDDRSLDINDEASLGMIDPAVAAELQKAFERDLASCRPVTLQEWKERSLWHRLVDRVSYTVNEQL